MLRKALPFLREILRRRLTQGLQGLSFCWGAREEFPSALALQRALREAFLPRGPQQAAPCIAKTAFEFVIGPRDARHIIAVEQAGPIALADLVEMQSKLMDGGRDMGPPPHRVEIAPQLSGDVRSAQGVCGRGL